MNSNVTFTPADFTAIDIGGQQRYRASRTYDVPLLHDTTDEEDERFTVTMAYVGMPQPHLIGARARATVTIVDDDHVPVTLGWDATQFTVEEPTSPNGSSTLTLTVRTVTVKDKQPDAGFTFDYRARTDDDGASAPEDYAALSATGTIARSDFRADQRGRPVPLGGGAGARHRHRLRHHGRARLSNFTATPGVRDPGDAAPAGR